MGIFPEYLKASAFVKFDILYSIFLVISFSFCLLFELCKWKTFYYKNRCFKWYKWPQLPVDLIKCVNILENRFLTSQGIFHIIKCNIHADIYTHNQIHTRIHPDNGLEHCIRNFLIADRSIELILNLSKITITKLSLWKRKINYFQSISIKNYFIPIVHKNEFQHFLKFWSH